MSCEGIVNLLNMDGVKGKGSRGRPPPCFLESIPQVLETQREAKGKRQSHCSMVIISLKKNFQIKEREKKK